MKEVHQPAFRVREMLRSQSAAVSSSGLAALLLLRFFDISSSRDFSGWSRPRCIFFLGEWTDSWGKGLDAGRGGAILHGFTRIIKTFKMRRVKLIHRPGGLNAGN